MEEEETTAPIKTTTKEDSSSSFSKLKNFEGEEEEEEEEKKKKKEIPLKLKFKTWQGVATWTWNDASDVCGICHSPYDGCAPDCKYPGDDSPRRVGSLFARVSFTMHNEMAGRTKLGTKMSHLSRRLGV